ncbi:MAG: hypothetical protein EXS55_04145, partial [Candidatus Magasanikbacteria bacterium]|nr:hypothetical protein [Candidatus Magasanikbacteria bacterium]
MIGRYRALVSGGIIVTGLLTGFLVARAETTSTGFSVGFTVPGVNNNAQGGGANQNNPPAPSAPTITNVVSSTTFTTASITWNANSQGGINSASFVYGLTNNYGSVGVINGAYKVDLANLTAGTSYYFKITVADPNGLTTVFTGDFKTKSNDVTPPVISNVVVVPGATTASVTWKTDEDADSQAQS